MDAYCKCDKCGEQAKVDTSMVLTSLPPKYNYTCEKCGYHGYVLTSEINSFNISGESGIFGRSNIRGISSYQLNDSRTCSSCSHRTVCKFKEAYEKKVAEMNFSPDEFMRIKIECIYYEASPLNIGYVTRDISDGISISSNPCATCDFTKKLAQEGTYVGDSPCEWCPSNPYKLTCTPLTSVNTATSVKATNKTIINENLNTTDKTKRN